MKYQGISVLKNKVLLPFIFLYVFMSSGISQQIVGTNAETFPITSLDDSLFLITATKRINGVNKWHRFNIAALRQHLSILTLNNVFTGKNRFADSLTADKGIKSGGLIDTKGVKTSGSSLLAATETNGVQKDAVIELTTSVSLDGTYNTIVCNPSTIDIILTLPALTTNNAGWKYSISKKQASGFNVRIIASGFYHVIFSPNIPITIRQRNGIWIAE